MTLILAVLLAVSAGACGADAPAGPPEINYGRDICIECGMIIGDDRFAAVYRLDDGTEKKFDDLGDLIIHGRGHDELDDARVWVSDFDQRVLIDAVPAHYVPTLGVVSPMGHGILAFEDESKARQIAASLGGEVISWDAVKALPVMEGRVGHHHDVGDGGTATGVEISGDMQTREGKGRE